MLYAIDSCIKFKIYSYVLIYLLNCNPHFWVYEGSIPKRVENFEQSHHNGCNAK